MIDALVWLVVALPAAAALAVRLLPQGRAVAAAGAAAGAVPASILLVAAASEERARSTFEWLPAANLEVGLRLDPLAAVMSATVAAAGLAVVIYSTGYFAGSERAPQALASLLAFLAAMQGLVLADGYLSLLIFWELVGALSARLIAWSRENPEAPGGAVRAFLTTRSADFGFYVALLALWGGTGSLAFGGERPEGALGALVGAGLLLAAMGKSAQAPLQTWLAGAMAGPTPVSALLHSATMVAAGVYLLVRSEPLLEGWPLAAAGWVGALTAVAGAAIALAQRDIKLVLAGSTTSQLGLMFVGAAVGGPAVALFHLIAHAAGKAGMFLSAGIFQHNRGTTDLAGLAGAGRDDPRAMAAFAVGAASIAGVAPLAAFWSKEAILAETTGNLAWLVLVTLAAAGSAAYLLRPALVLAGVQRGRTRPLGASRAVASAGRPAMLLGAFALAAASLLLGAAGAPLASLLGEPAPVPTALSLVLSMLALAAGLAAVWYGVPVAAWLRDAARRQLYAYALQERVAQRPLIAAAAASRYVDDRLVDRAVDSMGRAGLSMARANDEAERRGVDFLVDGLARLVRETGDDSRRLESGRLHEYLRDTVAGTAAVAFVIVLAALT